MPVGKRSGTQNDGRLCPRDVLEAMLAARFVAFHFQIMDDVRYAAQRDLPAALRLRYRANSAALTRVQKRTECDLKLRQALPGPQLSGCVLG